MSEEEISLFKEEIYTGQKLKEDVIYVASNGCFQFIDNSLITMTQAVKDYEPKVQKQFYTGYKKININRIPIGIIDQAYSYFYDIHEKTKSEVAIILWHNPNKNEWRIEVPEQKCTNTSVEYKRDQELFHDWSKKGFFEAGSIHSHGTMTAFHSTTDNKDELNFDGLHMTIGKIDTTPEFSQRLIAGINEIKMDFADIVETEYIKQSVSYVETPKEWMDKVTVTKPLVTKTKHNGYKVTNAYDNKQVEAQKVNRMIKKAMKGFNLTNRDKRNLRKCVDIKTMDLKCPLCGDTQDINIGIMCCNCDFTFTDEPEYHKLVLGRAVFVGVQKSDYYKGVEELF